MKAKDLVRGGLLGVVAGCGAVGALLSVPIEVDLASHGSDDPNEPVRSWDVSAEVGPDSPVFVSRPANADIGPMLLVDALARADGVDEVAKLTVEGLSATGAPFVLYMSLGGDGVMSMEPGVRAPVFPPECVIPVDPANLDAEAHAAELLACMRAWVDANGVPAKPTVTFSIGS